MKIEEEIVKKIKDLESALKENDSDHFKIVYESQVYILNWALEKSR